MVKLSIDELLSWNDAWTSVVSVKTKNGNIISFNEPLDCFVSDDIILGSFNDGKFIPEIAVWSEQIEYIDIKMEVIENV